MDLTVFLDGPAPAAAGAVARADDALRRAGRAQLAATRELCVHVGSARVSLKAKFACDPWYESLRCGMSDGERRMTEEYADAFGVLKHMFPLTPIELGEGFIVGRERLLSAVSITRTWGADGPDEPTVLIFDINGRRVDPRGRFAVTSENGRRRVSLKLTDWAEVAVIE